MPQPRDQSEMTKVCISNMSTFFPCVGSGAVVKMCDEQNDFDDLNDESYLSMSVDFNDDDSAQAQTDVGSNEDEDARSNEGEADVRANVDGDVRANEGEADVRANVDEDVRVNAVEDESVNDVGGHDRASTLTIREYQKVFAKQNSKYGTCKIPNSNPAMCYIRQRVKMPTRGRPVIYVAEGVQRQNIPRLLCPGRTGTTTYFDNGKSAFVVLGVIWVSKFVLHVIAFIVCLHIYFYTTPHDRSVAASTDRLIDHAINHANRVSSSSLTHTSSNLRHCNNLHCSRSRHKQFTKINHCNCVALSACKTSNKQKNGGLTC